METMWFPGHHMVSMSCGIHLETMWCSCDNHVVSTWKPQGVNMETMWCQPGKNVVFTGKSHGFHIENMWFPCGHNMVTM